MNELFHTGNNNNNNNNKITVIIPVGLPSRLSGKESACQGGRQGFDLWVGKFHFSILAWETPWTKELGGLQPMGHQKVRNNLATKQQ